MTNQGLINDLLSQVRSTKYVPQYITGCKYRVARMITTLTINNNAADLLRDLILDGSDLNIPNDEGEYPIEIACRLDNKRLFNLMIKHGADPSHSSVDDHSYLCKYASSYKFGKTFILKKYTLEPLIRMIVRGANIHQPCKHLNRDKCHTNNGMLRLTPRLFGYHVKRVRVVTEFIDLYGVCNDVGLLIRSFGGECVKCIGK